MLTSGGGGSTRAIMGAHSRGAIRLAASLLVRAWHAFLEIHVHADVSQSGPCVGGYM